MAVKEIAFKCTKASTYYTIGGVRLYDKNDKIYPIKFSSKNGLTSNIFYIQGTDITGTVSATNSWGTYYFVDSPFDTDKSIVTSYPNVNYWLSSSADTIKITFNIPVKISKIDFVPYCGNGTDRKQNAVEIIVIDETQNIFLQEKCNTSTYVENQVYPVLTPTLTSLRSVLLKSNDSIYSYESNNVKHVTKMTSNTTPSPLVASASSIYSSSYPAWLAFNGTRTDVNNCWITSSSLLTDQWVQIDFKDKKRVSHIEVVGMGVNPTSSPKNFTVSGSNDGISFYPLLKINNQINWGTFESRGFNFNYVVNYRYYRFHIHDNNGYASYTGIVDIVYSLNGSALMNLNNSSKKSFVNYGNIRLFDMNKPIKVVDYVLEEGESTDDSEYIMTQKINRKPLSISFN
ncbi:discoidin domain-containing protein [Lysinibacillus fusiformis]|uniref:discoidin domain-containing protein n=1 Tax=Lysinibacillus fusiformis TaxID=28031 RepID=UPI0021C093F1|nr:discoidin domain-containing protein [Lysinibacillus fusiformis]UXJ70198.1 discoidin domain-containing protein [Lysinibacillus fusiformis]